MTPFIPFGVVPHDTVHQMTLVVSSSKTSKTSNIMYEETNVIEPSRSSYKKLEYFFGQQLFEKFVYVCVVLHVWAHRQEDSPMFDDVFGRRA